MITEFQNEKPQQGKACSETSLPREIFVGPKDDESSKRPAETKYSITKNKNFRCLDRKSQSLDDLCIQLNHEICSSKRSETLVFFKTGKNHKVFLRKVTATDGNGNRIARRRILNLLMLNAWRRQKVGYKLAQEKIESLNNKLEGFEMQVYVLRQLLNAEKKRVETANENNRQLSQKVEENEKEKLSLLKQKEELENNFTKLIEYCGQIENALRNQENDIITSRLEAENWEKQLEKEREKLKKMESEEIFLKEKVRLNEKVIILKTQQVDQLTQTNKELQQKLDVQVPLWDETMAQVDLANVKLKEAEVVRNELQKALDNKDMEIKQLKSTVECLEKKLQEEDEKNGLLGKSILEKTNELSLIQKKFGELSTNHYSLSGGIIKVASLCAKIPVACICTVGSLLLPSPSYRLQL